jgi:RNA polymerase sigma factor (sigma-70 family)
VAVESAPAAAPDFEVLYEQHVPVMIGVAIGRFGIAESDAETLAHEVFVDFMQKHERVCDARSWLISSIYRASMYHLRRMARTEPLPDTINESPDPESLRAADAWADRLAGRQAFECATVRCQLALRLRYIEGYTIPEIAEELKTTPRYAAKLVSECLRQANRRYTRLGRGEENPR